jgi:hypothetical protein
LTGGCRSGLIRAVPKYDAFGREIGEDTLSGLGGGGAQPSPVPVEEHDPPIMAAPAEEQLPPSGPGAPERQPRPAMFVRRRRRRGFGGLLMISILVLAAGLGAGALVQVGGDLEDRLEGLLPDEIAGPVPAPQEAPVGVEGASLVARANFEQALAELESNDLGRPAVLRVAPERIDATLRTDGGEVNQVQLRFDGELRQFGTSGGGDNLPAVAYARLDPAAPERLVRRGARRVSTTPRRIDYVLFTAAPGGPPTWAAYFKNGRFVVGNARGSVIRVP